MMILSVNNLGKSYSTYSSELVRFARWFGFPFKANKENWILKNISFNLQKGESLGVVGKNGAGKSTLLKMLTGVLQPTEGTLQVNGNVAAILELGMGFNADLTARENVCHTLGLMGYSHTEIIKALPEIESFSEIGDYFDKPMRTYSSGMQMRVAFSTVTAFRPDILIVDEALSVGDAFFQAKCFERISSYKDQGMSLLLVTHSTSDVLRHCDRAIFLKDGNLVFDGSTKDVTNMYLSSLSPKKSKITKSIEKNINKKTIIKHYANDPLDQFTSRPGYRKEEHRWGQGGASIVDYFIHSENEEYPSVVYANDIVDISFSVSFEDDFDSVVPGILIKTIDGMFLYGTNSYLASQSVSSVKKGDLVSYKFSIPFELNTGDYLISFGISSGNLEALHPLDRRYDSVVLNVKHRTGVLGLIDLRATYLENIIDYA